MTRLSAVFAAASVFALAACGEENADAPGSETSAEDTAQEVTVYSARHYDSDEAVYDAFTEQTGIAVRTIEASGDLLIERIKADGERSPADVVITVDAGRLWRAEQEDVFQPFLSDTLAERVPANVRHPDNLWFGFAKRARVLVYANDRVDPEMVTGYESLADPAFEGRVCVRSSGNIYNVSLLAALIERWGAEAAEDWAESVVSNFARIPSGGDTDQIRAVAAGECDLALVNHYYYARLAASEEVDDQSVADAVSVLWPESDGGVHVNISGAGLAANAPNPEAAAQFLEFLISDQAQRLYAELTNEYPVVNGVDYYNPTLDSMGAFQSDELNVSTLGDNQAEAQRVFDRAGWP